MKGIHPLHCLCLILLVIGFTMYDSVKSRKCNLSKATTATFQKTQVSSALDNDTSTSSTSTSSTGTGSGRNDDEDDEDDDDDDEDVVNIDEIDLYWEDDDTLVQGTDDYVYRPVTARSSTNKYHDHYMPIKYADPTILKDIDFSKRSSCGVSKCFWPSVSDPTVGYLLTTEGIYDGLYYAYDVAQDIAEHCGARHTFVEDTPVVLVKVSEEYMANLARLVFNPSRNEAGQKSPWVFHPKDTAVAVQKVARAPSPNLLYGTGGTKWQAMVRDIPKFRQEVEISLPQLRERLQQEAIRIQCVLDRYPTFWLDFQGLIDTKGNFYYMDMDETFYVRPRLRGQNKIAQQSCLANFNLMVKGLTQQPEYNPSMLLDEKTPDGYDP